ncbi:conserved hypothetical protein [Arthrobacter sp. Hiyo4]|nr:conserved hypothetical protein [Arthrobacter sp. Hiyo4]
MRVSGSGGDSTLYVSAAKSATVQQVAVPEGFVLVQRQYDSAGQPVKGSADSAGSTSGRVTVAPCGFTMVTLTAG